MNNFGFETLICGDKASRVVILLGRPRLFNTSVGAGSPDPAPALTEGLPLPQAGDLRSAEGHGQETLPQRELREMIDMKTITVEEAQGHLTEIIEALPPGEEIVITRDDKPVAALRALIPAMPPNQRQLGTLKGSVLYIAPDFDTIPEGFEEYVE
jgi:antitoxin (DNA-binding transcriptional repressor) of toxin-antitoxin stability system